MGVIYSLLSALVWGGSDFAGGVAARRGHHYQVLLLAAVSGTATLLLLAVLFGEQIPAPVDFAWSTAAGLAGALGIATLYGALAKGNAALVSPVAAVIGAAIPAVASVFLEGAPGLAQQAGFALGLAGIGLVSYASPASRQAVRSFVWLALMAGVMFGAFFICIAQVEKGTVFAPLAVAKAISFVTALVVLRFIHLPAQAPSANPLAVLTGVTDVSGNVFFLLAAQYTRLDVAAVLSSMYPAVTVLLSRIIHREHITRGQWLGVALCLGGVALISL